VSAASTSVDPEDEVARLRAANERLQQRLAMLELRLTSESTASLPSPHPPALPASVPAGLQGAPGLAWKRGASSNNAINEPPPLPPWAKGIAMRNGR